MVWVKSELAEELAVLAAWLSALIPWSVSISLGEIQGGTLVEVRFPFGLIRYLFGIAIGGDTALQNPLLKTPWGAAEFYAGSPGSLPFHIWTVGAGIIGLALLLSFGMYFFEERLVHSAVDPVRLMGGLLLLAAIVLTASSYVLQFGTEPISPSKTFPGVLVPVGVLIQYAFAYILLRVERVDEGTTDAETVPNDPA